MARALASPIRSPACIAYSPQLDTTIDDGFSAGSFAVVEYLTPGEQLAPIGWVPLQRDRVAKLHVVDVAEGAEREDRARLALRQRDRDGDAGALSEGAPRELPRVGAVRTA